MTNSKSKGEENHWTFYGFQFIGCNQDANNTNFDVWWGLPVCQALLLSLYMLHAISIYTNVYIYYILATYIYRIYHSMMLLDNISIKQKYVHTHTQSILEGWYTLQMRKPRHSKVTLTCTASEQQSSCRNSGSLTPEPMLAHCTSAAPTLGWALCCMLKPLRWISHWTRPLFLRSSQSDGWGRRIITVRQDSAGWAEFRWWLALHPLVGYQDKVLHLQECCVQRQETAGTIMGLPSGWATAGGGRSNTKPEELAKAKSEEPWMPAYTACTFILWDMQSWWWFVGRRLRCQNVVQKYYCEVDWRGKLCREETHKTLL